MAMIVNVRGKCIVRNDSNGNEKWPELFACRPIVGDIVCSYSGKEFTIVAIKHAEETEEREGEKWLVPKMTVVLDEMKK